jgi:flagellar motor switch protein FliM
MNTESKLITAEEMEALTAGFVSGTGKKEQPYDPRRSLPVGPRPEQELRALRRIHSEIANVTSASLSARLRSRITVEPQNDEPLTFSTFRDNLARTGMVCINLLEMPPLGDGLLTLDLPTCFRFIDRYLGGSGKAAVPQRAFFTDIETATIDELVQLFLVGFQRGWQRVLPQFEPKFRQREFDPKMLGLWPLTERVLASTFNIVSDVVTGEMKLCLPYGPVVQLLPKPGSVEFREQVGDNLAVVPAIEKRLQKVPLTLRAILGTTEISVRDLLRLKVGDMIRLQNPVTQPVHLQVEGETKFSARLGRVGKKFGLQVEKTLPELEE